MPDIIITPSSGIIDFFPVSTRVGRIEGSGNTINVVNPSGFVAVSGSGMSINTSAPNALLHAYSSISGATILNLEGTNGSLFSVVDNLSGSLMSVNNNAGLPVFEVFSDDRVVAGRFGQNDFVMTSGGNIGIGTGVPSSKFHVVGTSTFNGDISSTGSFIAGSGSAGNPSFEFVNDTDTGMFSPAANTIGLSTSGVERLRIIDAGRVGIGTSTPSGQLHVVGSGIFSSGVYINNIGITGNMVFATNTNGNLIIKPNGSGSLQADDSGNSRGLYSVDLQRSRTSASGVSVGNYSVVAGGHNNRASGDSSVVVGGQNNTSSGIGSTIGGGQSNTNTAENGVIAGGIGNTAAGIYGPCVGGGYYNTSSGYAATVAGGRNNSSTNDYSSIGGGVNNTSSGSNSTVGGGSSNTASSTNSTVGGGSSNTASSSNSTVCGGTFNTASNGYCTVTGGRSNTSSNMYATVGGGYVNTASGAGSTVGGGKTNTASEYCSAIAGGISNNASGSQSAVCGGSSNTASGTCSTVGGGTVNTSSGAYSTITGGKECVSHQHGEEARSSGKFVENGDAQIRKLLMRGKTNVTNNTVLLTLDGSLKDISTIDNSCIISHHRYDANDSSKQYTWLYNIKVVARHISATTPTSAAYKFEGILESSSAAGVILLGNTKTVIYEDNADFDCNIYEYNTNSAVRTDGLYIEVSNSLSADEDIYWVAYVEILEVGITEYDTPAY